MVLIDPDYSDLAEDVGTSNRHAKNLAEALDLTRRREAIDLPPFVALPATACVEGGGWTEVAVSRRGWLRVAVAGPANAVYSGRVLTIGDQLELAIAPDQAIDATKTAILQMRLNEAGRALLAEGSNRLPALLETIVEEPDGSVCRSTSPALLRIDPAGF